MVLVELVTYLASDGIGTAATDLFHSTLPESPDACVVLYEYGGRPNEPELGGTTVRLEFPRIQAVARGIKDDVTGPRLKIQQVIASFTKIGEHVLSGVQYHAVLNVTPAFPLMVDDNGRHIFAANFECMKGFSAT